MLYWELWHWLQAFGSVNFSITCAFKENTIIKNKNIKRIKFPSILILQLIILKKYKNIHKVGTKSMS